MTDAPDRIIRLRTVLDQTGLRRSTVYRKMAEGTFPKQLKLAARCAGWRQREVADWLRNSMFYRVEDSR